jgi:SAM-dependent methyltransferase
MVATLKTMLFNQNGELKLANVQKYHNNGHTIVMENHLGGFETNTEQFPNGDMNTFSPKLWEYIIKKYKVNSVIDVGCGMGFSLVEFLKHCKNVVGIDGSEFALENSPAKELIFKHDYSIGELETENRFDLCWSCEFVEHVDEEYRDNFLSTFAFAKYVAMTFAEPGQPGHHHVNCQPQEYWIEHLARFGFKYDDQATLELRQVAKEEGEDDGYFKYFEKTGLFFVKQ